MSEHLHPRNERDDVQARRTPELPARPGGEPAVGFRPERLPPRPGVWAAEDASAMGGEWIDGTLEPGALSEALDGRDVYDTIGFGDFTVQPDEAPEVISAVARGIREHGYGFAAWAELHEADPGMLAAFGDTYLGHYENLADFGAELASGDWQRTAETLPQRLTPYVRLDYQSLAADQLRGTSVTALPDERGGFWLFAGPDDLTDGETEVTPDGGQPENVIR